MKDVLHFIKWFVIVIVCLVALRYVGLEMWRYFGPKEAQVEREIFEGTKVYNDGMTRDLENLMLEYNKVPKVEKEALRSVILHRFAVYPSERLSPELRSFYTQLKSE